MIRTYLRLDLFIEEKRLKLVDQIDLQMHENIYDVLQGFDDFDYAELVLVTSVDHNLHEFLSACFRRIKLKNRHQYNWILCEQKDT